MSLNTFRYCTHTSMKTVEVAAVSPPFSYQYLVSLTPPYLIIYESRHLAIVTYYHSRFSLLLVNFDLDEQCASVLLTTYIPVYIYIYAFQVLAPVAYLIMATCGDSRYVPTWIKDRFPSISLPVLSKYVTSPNRLINVRNVITSFGHHMAVTLTFGLCSPYLAGAIGATVLSNVLLWKYLVGRCAWNHIHVWNFEQEDRYVECFGKAESICGDDSRYHHKSETSSSISQFSDKIYIMDALDAAVSGVSCIVMRMVWPVVCLSGMFMGMICWDMAGDREGWQKSVWIPLTSVCIPIVLWATVSIVRTQHEREKHSHMPRTETGSASCATNIGTVNINDDQVTRGLELRSSSLITRSPLVPTCKSNFP